MMSRTALALLALLLLAGALLWLFAGQETGRRDAPGPGESSPAPALGPVAEAPAPLAEPQVEAEEARRASAPAAPAPRVAVAPIPAEELARAQWVEGRVLFPPGMPADEELTVEAQGRTFSGQRAHRAPVARDGSFRVAFSADSAAGALRLEAHYLFLAEEARWQRGDAEPLVLRPLLGARVLGQVGVREELTHAPLDGRVILHVPQARGGEPSTDAPQHAVRDEQPSFAFGGLRPGSGYRLGYDGPRWTARGQPFDLAPGEVRLLALELVPGVTLAGSVRDERGLPVAGAELRASVELPDAAGDVSHQRLATSAADGGFRLGALAGGRTTLELHAPGFRPLTRTLGKLVDGTDLAGLELVLQRGGALSGSVRWPDGSPAPATVWLTPLPELRAPEAETHCDAAGRFEVSGLSATSYRLRARAVRAEELHAVSELTGHDRARKQRSVWVAEIDAVQAGASGLELTLSPGLTAAGLVRDERGLAVDDFRVWAERIEGEERGAGQIVDGRFRAGGAFTLAGFLPGVWEFRASARGHAESEPLRVTLPAAAPLLLVTPREAQASGFVLDALGAPVADARVTLGQAEDGGLRAFEPGNAAIETRSGADGSFRLSGPRAGSVFLRAEDHGGAPSAPVAAELVAGQETDGIVLVLVHHGRVSGEVLDGDGRALAGVRVWIREEEHDYARELASDAQGRFVFEQVPPGALQVFAEHPAGMALGRALELGPGESAHVRLEAPRTLVRLSGTVRAGGQELGGATVTASYAGGEDGPVLLFPHGAVQTDDAGAYALDLPGPGAYRLQIDALGPTRLSWRVLVEVPAVAEHSHDVDIPLARISGRVRDTRGQPLPGIVVESEPEQHENGAHGGARTESDAEGHYELRVPAGRHAVRARDEQHPAGAEAGDEAAGLGEARVGGLVLGENDDLRGIDLVLAASGTLAGSVRLADGTLQPGAELWSLGELRPRVLGRSDAGGAFRLEGLVPGSYLLAATAHGAATPAPLVVELHARATLRVDFELVPATRVHLLVQDARGAGVGSEVSVLDARGVRQVFRDAGQAGDLWVGPLAAGSYTFRAQRDGRTVERGLELEADGEPRELVLRFE